MPSQEKIHYDNLTYPQVVVVGGGFAGLELIKRLENTPYKVLLVDRTNHHCFQPLLYQVATAGLSADSIAHPFRRTVAPMSNVAFRMATVLSVDPQKKQLRTDRGVFNFDILVISTGSTTNFFGQKDLQHWAMPLKSIAQALDIRSDFLQEFETAVHLIDEREQRKYLNFVIVGGGPTGVELAGALAEIKKNVLRREYKEVETDRMQIWLIDANERVLKNFSEKSSRIAQKYLEKLGVSLMLNTRVNSCDENCITMDNGQVMETNTVIWAAGVRGASLPGLEVARNERSRRYLVDRYMKVEGYQDIYALGDVACMPEGEWERGHPQVAPVAIAQAELLARNLIRLSRGRMPVPFHYEHRGQMATIGRGKAVADVGKRSFGGILAWLVWMFVHLMQLVNFRNRIMVLMNWAWKYISWKNTIRLIIRPYRGQGALSVEEPVEQ